MPTRDLVPALNAPVTQAVIVVVDPSKHDIPAGSRPIGDERGQETPTRQTRDLPDVVCGSNGTAAGDSRRKRCRGVRVSDFTAIRIPTGSIGALYPQSKFLGHQRSGKCLYEVDITIKHIDLRTNKLSGLFHIRNLTSQDITTFFTGEIISSSHEFFTNPYGAEPKIDLRHWSKFPHLNDLMHAWAKNYPYVPDVNYDFISQDFIYARWKERHLVPDHNQNVLEACFAGFYYVSYQKSTGTITGWYYHKNSELNQKLTLKATHPICRPNS